MNPEAAWRSSRQLPATVFELKGPKNGTVLIWTAALMSLIVPLVGLSLDWGYALLVAHQLQNAADAAALAGAQEVRSDQAAARTAAIDVAAANKAAKQAIQLSANDGNASDGDIVLGRYDRDTLTFTSTTTGPNAVKVAARRTSASLNGPLSLIFAPVFGVPTIQFSRTAIAMVGGGTGPSVIVLSPHGSKALNMTGTTILDAGGAAVQVNSDATDAVKGSNTATIDATDLNVVGGVSFSGSSGTTGNLNLGVDPVPDPLASLAEPNTAAMTSYPLRSYSGSDTATLDPGFYTAGVTLSGSAHVTLNPGIYAFGGQGLKLAQLSTVTAENCLLYFTGTGTLSLSGTGSVTISPPDPSVNNYSGATTYEGVSIFQARADLKEATMTGSSGLHISGALYFPSNKLKLSGGGASFGNQIFAGMLELTGSGTIHIPSNGSYPAAAGFRVFLVQ
jgi:Flp pilus assembly protein TadG